MTIWTSDDDDDEIESTFDTKRDYVPRKLYSQMVRSQSEYDDDEILIPSSEGPPEVEK